MADGRRDKDGRISDGILHIPIVPVVYSAIMTVDF